MADNPFLKIIDEKVAADESPLGSGSNPFVPLIDQDANDMAIGFRAAMHEAKDTDPDAYAKQVALSKSTGVPVDVVSRNPDKVKREAPFLSGEYEDLLQTHPATVNFLSKEDNAKFAKDDIPQLTVMEQLAKMSDQPGVVNTLGKSFMSGVSSINAGIAQSPAFVYNAAAATYNLAAKPFQGLGIDVKEIGTAPDFILNNPVAQYYKKAAEYYAPEELSQDPIELMKQGNGGQAARAIAAQVVANLPQQVFLIASTLAGRPDVGLSAMGVLSASQATAQAQENGKTPIQATIDSIAQGSIEMATEQFGTVGIVKYWETALARSFGKGTAKQIIADAGKSIAAAFFGEGTEEFIAQIGQDFSDYATGNSKALDGTVQRAMNAFLIGGFSGGVITSPTVLTAATVKSQRASQDGNFWDRTLGVSAESKLRQRSPERYEAFVNNILDETGKSKNIYVSYDALQTFFQTPEGKPDEGALAKFLDEMGVKDQLAEAANTGKEFELSAAKFAARFAGSDLSQAIRGDIRFSPDGMTQKEQAALKEDYQKMVLEMQQEYAQLVESQKLPPELQTMRDKLILPKDVGGAGVSAEEADAQLSVFTAGLSAFARKSGVSLEEYVRKVNPVLNIDGQSVDVAPVKADPNSTKKAKPIDFTDPVNVQYRDTIAAAGGEFIGTQPGFTKKSTGETTEGLVMFNDPVTGTTLALKPSLLTPENIAEKIKGAQENFNKNKLYQSDGIPVELAYLADEVKQFNSPAEFVKNKLEFLRSQFQRPEEIARNIETLRANGIEVSGPDDIVTVYHGTNGKGLKGIEAVGLNPNSYLATDKKAADLFAGRRGGVITLQVPVRDLGFVSNSTMAGTSGVTAVTAMKLRKDEAGVWRTSVNEDPSKEIPGIGLPPGITADGFFKRVTANRAPAQTETPEFKKFFEGSKVVDEQGKPLVVYHGTDAAFSVFDASKSGKGKAAPSSLGFWFADEKQNYAAFHGDKVVEAYLSMKNPFYLQSSEELQKLGNDKNAVQRLKAQGYDGVVLKGGSDTFAGQAVKTPSIYAVFEPTQIKSATGNNGNFDASNPDIFYQTPQGDLVAMHNLSAENLLHADKIGGLAVPSLSIAKQQHPLTGFGEISLVGSKELIDPRKKSNKVFNADVYSPRYPSVKYVMNNKAVRHFDDKVFKEAGDALDTSFSRNLDSAGVEYNGFSDFLRIPVLQLAYLNEIGEKFRVPVKTAKTPTLDLNPELKKFIDRYSAFGAEEAKKPGFLEAYEKARLAEKAKFIKGQVKDGQTLEEAEATYNEVFSNVWYDEGVPNHRIIRTMADEVRALEEKGKPDYHVAKSRLSDIIREKHQKGFEAWARTIFDAVVKEEKIRAGETPDGYTRYLPHNLENVVKVMKRTLQDGEGFNYGVGSIRATVAKRFRSIAEIQKDRSNIIPEAEMKALKDEVDNELFELMDQFTPYMESYDPKALGTADRFSEHLKEMTSRGVKAVVDDYYRGYVPAEVLQKANEFLNKLRNMPTEYFEAKIQRAVGLNEFSAALVPSDVSQEVLDVLQKNGITNVVKYTKGNEDTRGAALETLRKQAPDLFFQNEARGSVQFTNTATIINLYKSANLSTFLHESGHIFMREMEKLVKSGAADPQTLADYETLKAFVGGNIETVEAQEKLARAFEAYLREGKAPSVKLVEAFRRFRDWLMAIYKAVTGLNVEITDEVRQVFDRLLASESEIEEAKQFYSAKKSLLDLLPVTPQQKERVEKAKKSSEEAALEKAVKERLGVYLRVQGGKAAIREQATNEIDAMPVYKAIKQGIDAGGVDAAFIKDQYGEQALKTIRTNHPNFAKQKAKAKKGRSFYAEVLARGGINPDTMGELERKYFKENGLFGLFRKDGFGLDEIAQELISEGILQVPEDKNEGDYLKSLLEAKENIPDADPFIPEEAISLAEIAAEQNFSSEGDLVNAIVKADRRSKAITDRSKEILKQKEQDLLKDLKSEERVPGEEAIHNDKSLTYLITEAEILAEKIAAASERRPERIEEKLYRTTAEEIIGKKTVRLAVRYDLYARAEQRAAKQAETALLNQDYSAALTAKKKQLLNHALVQAAIKARDEKLKIENFYKAKNYKAKLANVENDFAQASIDLTNTFGLGTGQFELKVTDALQRIRKADEFLYESIPEWVVNKQLPKNFEDYRDLTMTQLRELNDAIRSILAYGNDEMKSIEEGEAKTLQEWVDASVAEMQKLKDRDVSKRDESSKLAKPLEFIDAFASGATLLQFTTDWMDNFSFMKTGNAGPFKRLYNKALDAEVKYNELKTEVIKESKKAWDILGKAAKRIKGVHGAHFEIPGVPLNEDMRRTKRGFWNVNRMVALLLNTGNAGNLSAVQRSYGYTLQQIQTIAGYFTAEELQALQDIWKATDLLFPRLDETHFSIYNRHLPKVEALPVTYQSLDGKQVKLDGGYYPLVFDHKINDQAAANAEDDLMKNQTQAVIRSTKPTDGFTFSRVAGHSLPPLLETSVWFNHINATSRYISHARILRDLNRLTRDKEWSKEFKKKAGDDHYKNIRAWLQYNANPGRRLLTSKIDLAADWLKSLSTAAVLGFKAVTGLKQRAALINGAQAIGKKKISNGWYWILKAYKEADWRVSALGLSQSETWASITKRSKYLKTRDGNIDREISDLRRGINPLEKKWKIAGRDFTTRDLQDFAFEWIRMNDRATVSIVWTAAYNQYVHELADKKATPEQVQKAAVVYADAIVQDTQASSLTPELSTIQRREGWFRLFTSFITGSMNYGNRIMQNHRAWREGAISNREFFNHVLQENIIFPYTMFLITQAFRGDDDELAWWEWAIVPFEAAASFIPLVRDLFAIQYGKKIGDSPVFEFPVRVGKALVSAGKFVVGDGEFTQAMWDIGRALEVYYKVPALNLVKDAVNMYENLTE